MINKASILLMLSSSFAFASAEPIKTVLHGGDGVLVVNVDSDGYKQITHVKGSEVDSFHDFGESGFMVLTYPFGSLSTSLDEKLKEVLLGESDGLSFQTVELVSRTHLVSLLDGNLEWLALLAGHDELMTISSEYTGGSELSIELKSESKSDNVHLRLDQIVNSEHDF